MAGASPERFELGRFDPGWPIHTPVGGVDIDTGSLGVTVLTGARCVPNMWIRGILPFIVCVFKLHLHRPFEIN